MFGRAKVRFVESICVDKLDLINLMQEVLNEEYESLLTPGICITLRNFLDKYGVTEDELTRYYQDEEGWHKTKAR